MADKNNKSSVDVFVNKSIDNIKADAIKEFADLVQSHLENYPYDERVRIDYVISLIRKKEKEMVGNK